MSPSEPPKRPQRRRRGTNRSALIVERLARAAITFGGIGTIFAVFGILFFLLWVVRPLFVGARIEGSQVYAVGDLGASETLRLGIDDGLNLAWTLDRSGEVSSFDLTTGARLERKALFPDGAPTASAFQSLSDEALFGFADGTLRTGRLGFDTSFLLGDDLPEHLQGLQPGSVEKHAGAIVERTNAGQLRATRFVGTFDEPVRVADGDPIELLDISYTPGGEAIATWQRDATTGDVRIAVSRVRIKTNMLTGEVTRKLTTIDLTPALPDVRETPRGMLLSGSGQSLLLAWSDGRVANFDLRDANEPRLIEELDVVPSPTATLTAFAALSGKIAFIVGDSEGHLSKWFTVRDEESERGDLFFKKVCEFPRGNAAVEHVAVASRSRVFITSFADLHLAGYHGTTGDQTFDSVSDEHIDALAIAPKQNAVLARTKSGLKLWRVRLEHLDATVASMFEPVWYEGYPGPQHTWQSTGGASDFEPKYGMLPLVFGTLKATLYSMLFGAPLALLAALYTSEFLSPRMRAPIKSTVELMASLPSVVLGFLAALVIAPFVQDILPATIAAFLMIPVAVLLGAYLWQLLPQAKAIRWQGWQRFMMIALTIPLGVLGGVALGGPIERVLFAGDVAAWLDGQRGGALGGWAFLLLPISGLLAALLNGRLLGGFVKERAARDSRSELARLELFRFFGWFIATLVLAFGLAAVLSALGFDPRGNLVGTYIQRNAMIVGFAMGFAIIPIIYTLAEDALSEVPGQLREGSLGAGATPWQTATRIVIPFAMSGMFSALMIGLGRAVGETMIVLMAAGNTPIMEWNIFAGFRTLTANIAVELPEAPKGSTHYLTLFLAALVLFALTFVLNTIAELVRRHFRRRMQAL
ncbi:MAG: ABC transporter permease subunit [Planctomycetota bacterium]